MLLYDCPFEICDKIWLYHELKKHCQDITVLDTKVRLSELWVAGRIGRIRAYLLMLAQAAKCLRYRKAEVLYVVWKRNSAILLHTVFAILGIRARIVSFNWLTPDEHSRLRYLIRKCLFDRHFLMIVNSQENIALYQNLYGLPDVDNILFLPDVYDTGTDFAVCNEEALTSDYFFTGGMSNRDFQLILELAPCFPEYRFVIVALKEQWKFPDSDIPPNVVIYFNTPQEKYYQLMKGARAVILPLLDERVAGLINICKAFQFGIICLISKTPATSLYYVNDKYLFGIGDRERLAQIIGLVKDFDRETYLSEVRIQQEHIKRTFSPEQVTEQLVFYLNERSNI